MKTWKILAGVAVGAAIYMLINTEKGEELQQDIADGVKDLKKKFDKMKDNAGDGLANLQKMVSSEITGLGEDARKRIMDIIEDGSDAAAAGKKKMNKMMA
ncbi:MAG: YtxH domain-containing protein [Taibaiella sp.]|nr:YtxH domain-containing protein [Taibaiella sp.]